MNNKLSELRKPVAWAFKEHVWATGLCGYVWRDKLEEAAPDTECESVKDISPLYSQEYVSALLQRIDELEVAEIKPEGLKLMIEAIGAHGYIVGCLVQGRPDLALEESRKWANAFSQAAEQSNG